MSGRLLIAGVAALLGLSALRSPAVHIQTGSGLSRSPLGESLSLLVFNKSQAFFHRGEDGQFIQHPISYPTPRDWLYRNTLPPPGIAHSTEYAAAEQSDLSRINATVTLMKIALHLDPINSNAGLDAAFVAKELGHNREQADAIMTNIRANISLFTPKEQCDYWCMEGIWAREYHDAARLKSSQDKLRAINPEDLDLGPRGRRQSVLRMTVK